MTVRPPALPFPGRNGSITLVLYHARAEDAIFFGEPISMPDGRLNKRFRPRVQPLTGPCGNGSHNLEPRPPS
jgi:hypothetical protein